MQTVSSFEAEMQAVRELMHQRHHSESRLGGVSAGEQTSLSKLVGEGAQGEEHGVVI
jgi:hypothetical protein